MSQSNELPPVGPDLSAEQAAERSDEARAATTGPGAKSGASRSHISIMAIAALLGIGMLAAASWIVQDRIAAQTRAEMGKALTTVLSTTDQAVRNWVRQHTADARSVADSPEVRRAAQALAELPRDAESLLKSPAQAQLRSWLRAGHIGSEYEGFLLIAGDDINLSADPDSEIGEVSALVPQELFLDRVRSGRAAISLPTRPQAAAADPQGGAQTGPPAMFVGAPVRNESGEIVAALALRVDPGEGFTDMLQRGRIGETGETYAFDRMGRLISESRFEDHLRRIGLLAAGSPAILNLDIRDPGVNMVEGELPTLPRDRQPLTRMARSAVAGESGLDLDSYRDYRGVPVVGAWIWNESFGLGLTTEIDAAEAYATLRDARLAITAFTVFSCALLMGFLLLFERDRRRIAASEQRLRSIADDLELRVEERTAELQKTNESVLAEIKERNRAEEALRESEARAKAILNTAFHLQGLLKSDGTLIEANTAALSMIDASEDDVVGRPFWDCPWWTHDPELQVQLRQAVKQAADGETAQLLATHPTPDGIEHIIEFRLTPVTDETGEVALIVPEGHDITDLKQAEAELRRAKEQAEEALAEITRMQTQLIQAEKMASLGQLTAGIAHEIKNPLNFVNNFAEVSKELFGELKELVDPLRKHLGEAANDDLDELLTLLSENLDRINNQGRRADNIVTSMLLHSRGDPGQRQPIELNELVEESLNLAYHGARARNPAFDIALDRDYDPEAGSAEIAPQEIGRVLLNLFQNAFDAVGERESNEASTGFGPSLHVVTKDLGDRVEVRVRDNGAGIPEAIIGKVFDPFFTTKAAGAGTGLGLSLSYDIVVQQHYGQMTVRSQANEFTEFIIALPRDAATRSPIQVQALGPDHFNQVTPAAAQDK